VEREKVPALALIERRPLSLPLCLGDNMKKLDNKRTKYRSLMDFAVLGRADEEIDLKTLIAVRKQKKKHNKPVERIAGILRV